MTSNENPTDDISGKTKGKALRILTVGDGDLTLSLSLCRAYGDQINVTATTLCSSYEELCSTYSNSARVVEELTQRDASILYSIDATKLSHYSSFTNQPAFDLILFHHPHLGLMTSLNSTDEQRHAQRHFVLLAHYLASAKSLLQTQNKSTETNPWIHLCLAHDQPQTWRMEEAAHRQGLKLVKTAETNRPFHALIHELLPETTELNLLPHEASYSAPRKYRNGKLGSKHFLGKYGYQHRRTHGDNFEGRAGDMNVNGSKHYFFAIKKDATPESEETRRDINGSAEANACSICGLSFASRAELEKHLEAPALPDPANVDFEPKSPVAENGISESNGTGPEKEPNHQPSVQITQPSKGAKLTATNDTPEWQVLPEHDQKRLRRFLQHVAFPKRSKKQCDTLVKEGQIQVNGVVALDCSRILKPGDVVSSTLATNDQVTNQLKACDMESLVSNVPIVASFPPDTAFSLPKNYLLVANKPAGMRTRGDYDSSQRTLEQVVSWQTKQGQKYKSLSSMATGCNGLCVLQLQSGEGNANVAVQHDFTVLVHGLVPEEWNHGFTVEVPWKCVRRFNRKRETIASYSDNLRQPAEEITEKEDKKIEENAEPGTAEEDDNSWTMTITCTERTSPLKRRHDDDSAAPPLCTLHISTDCPVSGTQQAIILYLRKHRFPVVGDRLCQKEYQTLPRSIRNRLKKKLLMGCFQVTIYASCCSPTGVGKGYHGSDAGIVQGQQAQFSNQESNNTFRWTASVETPDRFRANFWQRHWENATTMNPTERASTEAAKK